MALRILVVDDASFARDTIKRTLRKYLPEAEIFDAINGNKAVSVMKVNKIDLILSDWEMPEMSGEELLQWVRGEERHQKVPFIMISSRGDRNYIIKAVQAGVSDYLSKPFSPDELTKKVAKQLGKMGYKAASKAKPLNSGFSSSEALLTAKPKSAVQKPQEVKAAAGFGRPAEAAPAPSAQKGSFDGRAQLRFANTTCQCVIRDLSLQAMSGVMVRPEAMPCVFDQAVVDMENAKGEAIARLNGYVHSMIALEQRPDTTRLKVTVRFVDNDPDKFEVLSKAIAKS